jgi:hypothetical protein
MAVKNLLFLFLGILPSILFAQREQVVFKVRNAAPMRNFEYHQSSVFDVVNGKFNAALASSNGYLFEITGVPIKLLKCKIDLTQKQFRVVLIDNKMNRTFSSDSKSKGTLKINCLPDGVYELTYIGDIYSDKQKINVTAHLVGSVSHSKFLKTN